MKMKKLCLLGGVDRFADYSSTKIFRFNVFYFCDWAVYIHLNSQIATSLDKHFNQVGITILFKILVEALPFLSL